MTRTRIAPPRFDPPLRACPVCFAKRVERSRVDAAGVRIDRCGECRIEFMNPQYTDGYLREFYEDYHARGANHHAFGRDDRPRELIHEHNLAQIETLRPPGRFLSVGCGKAIDVAVAKRRGWRAEGYDVDATFVAGRAAELEVPIHSGAFCELDWKPAAYDCVYMNHSLEHPKNPGEYLATIRDLLAPGGLLYVACPNIDSLSNRTKNALDALHLRAEPASHYDTWHHLTYFSPVKLAHLLVRNLGFEVVFRGNDVKARKGDERVRTTPLDRWVRKSTFRLIARVPARTQSV